MTTKRETPLQAMERNLLRIRTEGLDAATDAGLQILRDPKAPAQARSNIVNAFYRASGLLERAGEEDPAEKRPSEMTREELDAAAAKVLRELGE